MWTKNVGKMGDKNMPWMENEHAHIVEQKAMRKSSELEAYVGIIDFGPVIRQKTMNKQIHTHTQKIYKIT